MLNQLNFFSVPDSPPNNLPKFPSTRYQGSKRKIIPLLATIFGDLQFDSALDLYSGSGMVSLLLRHLGKKVAANDYLKFNAQTADLFLNVDQTDFDIPKFTERLSYLLCEAPLNGTCKVSNNYRGVFFLDIENEQIDRFCQNLRCMGLSRLEIDLMTYCVGQALLMKRPYNLFHRANLQMRTRKVKRSFGNAKTWETSIFDHSRRIYKELASFPFPKRDEKRENIVFNSNTMNLSSLPKTYDLVYLDPPYLNTKGIGLRYTDFYHFLDGLCDYALFDQGKSNLSHRPIISNESAWTNESGAIEEIKSVVNHWPNSILMVSYRSDGKPTESVMSEILSANGRTVDLHAEVRYKYALSHSEATKEQVIISTPRSAEKMR